jgi:cohesin complex subunit SCC1
MPAAQNMASREAITLPDVLTEADNLEMPPLPDASFLLSQMNEDTPSRRRRAGSINLAEEFGASQYLQESVVEKPRYDDEELALDEDLGDLGLDLGEDIMHVDDISMEPEIGRRAEKVARPSGDDFADTDLNIFGGKDAPSVLGERRDSMGVSIAEQNDDNFPIMDDEGDYNLLDADNFPIGDGADVTLGTSTRPGIGRISESPLSDLDPNVELEQTFQLDETEHSIVRKPAQRAKKVKLLQADNETMISSSVIKAQQQDRSKILRPQSSLPRDPVLLALMEMQRNGGFVSSIMGDGRSAGWAPELRGMLSLDAIAKSRDLKRKRDSGIADMDGEDGQAQKSPRLALDLGDEDQLGNISAVAGFDVAPAQEESVIELPEEGFQPLMEDDEGYARQESEAAESPRPDFDQTTAPLVHPADSGPISLGTKRAVYAFREKFGAEDTTSPEKRSKASVLFQDMFPEATTSRADATTMFFEMLVLATKDAVKVEQKDRDLGAPIRVRGKRALWSEWAEREAGGAIAEQSQAEAARQVAVEA